MGELGSFDVPVLKRGVKRVVMNRPRAEAMNPLILLAPLAFSLASWRSSLLLVRPNEPLEPDWAGERSAGREVVSSKTYSQDVVT